MSAQPIEESQEFPTLLKPPIGEVACGVVFDPTAIGVLEWGIYWDTRKKDFPRTSLHPVITEGLTFSLGAVGPMRVWLESEDSSRLIQLQHDRFFFNWRTVSGKTDRSSYPHFRDRPPRPGICSQAIAEFETLRGFCADRFGESLKLRKIELVKIDVLTRGVDWEDMTDLVKLMPITGTFAAIHRSNEREVALRFVENILGQTVVVQINTVGAASGFQLSVGTEGSQTSAVRIESRAIAPFVEGSDLRSVFAETNAALNKIFFTLIPKTELHRFGIPEDPHG